MKRTVECCCGKSRVEVHGEPVFSAVCHCKNCQKRTGSAFGISVYFSEDQVDLISDAMAVYKVDAETGPQERRFCSDCGTTLHWISARFPNMVGIAGGCFREEIPTPNVSASSISRCDWVQLPDSWRMVD